MTKDMPPTPRHAKVGAEPEASLYERIGAEKVERLVAAFYARVDSDPVIRPLYGKTLTCAIHALTDFMTTWLGGPPVYDVRAARLRRRHLPFAIDSRARDDDAIEGRARRLGKALRALERVFARVGAVLLLALPALAQALSASPMISACQLPDWMAILRPQRSAGSNLAGLPALMAQRLPLSK